MLITNRQKKQNKNKTKQKQNKQTLTNNILTLSYNDIELQITCCEKYLGVHFDDNLECL